MEWQRGGLPSQGLQRHGEGAEVPGSLQKPELFTSAAPTTRQPKGPAPVSWKLFFPNLIVPDRNTSAPQGARYRFHPFTSVV